MVYLTVVCLVDEPTRRDELDHMMAQLSILFLFGGSWMTKETGDTASSRSGGIATELLEVVLLLLSMLYPLGLNNCRF